MIKIGFYKARAAEVSGICNYTWQQTNGSYRGEVYATAYKQKAGR